MVAVTVVTLIGGGDVCAETMLAAKAQASSRTSRKAIWSSIPTFEGLSERRSNLLR